LTDVDPVVADAVDRATDGFVTYSQVVERLTNESQVLDPATYDHAQLDAMRAAACFRLLPDGTFCGDFAGDGRTPWPRTPAELSPDVLGIWRAYAATVRSAAWRAHLNDLLAAAGASPRYQYAREAVSAYREAVPAFLSSHEKVSGRVRAVESLARGVELACSMNQRDLRDLVAQDILGLAGDLLSDDPPPCGLIFRLLEALQTRRLETTAVRDLIERASSGGRLDDMHLHVMFLRLLRSTYPEPDDQKVIDRRIVTVMMTHAEGMQRMLRLMTLNHAAVLARDCGLTDLFEDANRKIQAMKQADLGLVRTGTITIQLSPEELDAAIAEVDEAADLAEALWRIAGTSAPGGDIAFAERAARAISVSAPLATSIPRGRINPAGPVPVSAPSDGLASTQAMFQVLNLERRGLAVCAQLDRIRERFAPDEDALVAVFAHEAFGSESRTRMLVHAFLHYWAGQDDAAVHLALPRVEALLREIERDRGVSVVNVARGNTPGGVSQLGALIAEMTAAGFDENWQRSFALLLTDGEHGLNLRNDVGHGLSDCPPRLHVGLVLHAALALLAVARGVMPLRVRGSGVGAAVPDPSVPDGDS